MGLYNFGREFLGANFWCPIPILSSLAVVGYGCSWPRRYSKLERLQGSIEVPGLILNGLVKVEIASLALSSLLVGSQHCIAIPSVTGVAVPAAVLLSANSVGCQSF